MNNSNNTVLLAALGLGGAYWWLHCAKRNPAGSRGPTKATQIKRIRRELDGWRDKLISQQSYSQTHYGNKDAGNSFIEKTIAMYERQLAELEGYGRNPFPPYDPADDPNANGTDNYYLGVLSEKFGELADIYANLGYPYPAPADKKAAAPKIKELQADIAQLKPLIRADWLKPAMKDFNAAIRYAKGED